MNIEKLIPMKIITIKNAVLKMKAFYTPVQKLSAYDDFDDKKEELRELNP